MKSIGTGNLYLGPLQIIDRILESVMIFKSRSLCNFIGQKGTNSNIYDLFVLIWGKVVRENHQIIDEILKLLAQNTQFINCRL